MKIVEHISFYVLLVLAGLRPLISESYDSAGVGVTSALSGISDPTPAATVVFDLLILLATAGWLVVRLRDPSRRYVKCGMEWGLGIIVVAAVVSCVFAGNKRLAINASMDWVCMGLHAIGLVQLMRRDWQRRLLLLVVLASATAQAAKCLEDQFVSFDQTWDYYQEIKGDMWRKQGVTLDSSHVELFERRMNAREAYGFMSHSNVAGSYLVLCALPAIGMAVSRWRRWALGKSSVGALATTFGAIVLVGAVASTKSTGAIASAVVGLALWLLWSVVARRLHTHRRGRVFAGAWMLIALGVASIVGHGWYHGSLPGSSLNFRWQYWTASAPLVADHAWTGVGRENFGRQYVAYKPIDAPEEVANPHNLFVQAAADWGLLGLAGLVVILVGGSWAAWVRRAPDEDSPQASPPTEHRGVHWAWCGVVLAGIVLARFPLLGTANPDFLYYAQMTLGMVWIAGFWFYHDAPGSPLDRVVLQGVGVGLLAFLLHETINFALFVPGSATTALAMFAVLVANPQRDSAGSTSPAPRFAAKPALAVTMAAILGAALLGLLPVARAYGYLTQARAVLTAQPSQIDQIATADHYYRLAMDADRWDPTPCAERARWWLMIGNSRADFADRALVAAEESVAAAIARDPHHVAHARLQTRVLLAQAEHSGARKDYLDAISAALRALKLYPMDPDGYLRLGDCRLAGAASLGDAALALLAAESFREAIALDDSRPEWERIRGLRDRELQQIEEKIARATAIANPRR